MFDVAMLCDATAFEKRSVTVYIGYLCVYLCISPWGGEIYVFLCSLQVMLLTLDFPLEIPMAVGDINWPV